MTLALVWGEPRMNIETFLVKKLKEAGVVHRKTSNAIKRVLQF